MPFVTRKGTRVLHPAASAMAIIHEIHYGSTEYEVYKYFRVGDPCEPRFSAEPPDRLYVKASDDIPTMAFVLNLVTGQQALIPWDALAHTAKPAQ